MIKIFFLGKIIILLVFACVVRTSAQEVKWVKSAPYISYQQSKNIVVCDNFGNTYISGTQNLGTQDNIFIIKYDSNGNKLWGKNYKDGNNVASLCIDSNGNLYAFMFAKYVEGDTFDSNKGALFAKYNKNGDILWVKQTKLYMALSEKTDAQDNIIVTGGVVDTVYLDNGIILTAPLGGSRLFLAKFNTTGECIWAQQGDGGDRPLIRDNKDEMFAMGYTYSDTMTLGQGNNQVTLYPVNGDSYIAKYYPSGKLAWVKQIASESTADEEGNLYSFQFDVSDLPHHSNRNAYLVKYDPQGHILWKRTHLYIDNWYSFSMKCGVNGDLYITGGFTNYMTIDSTTVYDGGNTRAFVAKIDSSGKLKWIFTSGGTGGAGAKDITVNGNEIYVTGDVGGGENIFGSQSVNEQAGVFALKIIDLENSSSAVNDITISDNTALIIYPNPGTGVFQINYSARETGKLKLNVVDIKGKIIYSETISQFNGELKKNINLGKQAKGIYFIEVVSENERRTKKIILE